MTERLLLIRHGESTWNVQDRWQGWAECPLSPYGESQAEQAARRLAGAGLSAVVSSDLGRARQTAGIIAGALGLGRVSIDPGMREYDVGVWSGLTRDEIDSGWPGVRTAWREGRLASLPGGETRGVFAARVLASVARLAARDDLGPAVLVVTHGGVVRLVERHLGLEAEPVPNLAGRWVQVGAESGELVAGARVELASPEQGDQPVEFTPSSSP